MNNKKAQHPLSGRNHRCIKCECGAEILLIPDVREMERVIIKHAESHSKKEKNPKKADTVFEQIQDFLVQQVLIKASETEEEIPKS